MVVTGHSGQCGGGTDVNQVNVVSGGTEVNQVNVVSGGTDVNQVNTLFPPFSPSLISRTVSVDVKHHVYLVVALTSIRSMWWWH